MYHCSENERLNSLLPRNRQAVPCVVVKLALELTGGDPVVSEHLGDVYFLLDQRRRALDYYEEAQAMSPRLEEQPDLEDKIEALREEFAPPASGYGTPEAR